MLTNTITLADDRRVRARWSAVWHPRMVLQCKSIHADSVLDDIMDRYECIHARAVEACLRAKLPWKTIVKYDLDDPMVADITRGGKIAAAVERQRTRLAGNKLRVKERHDRHVLSS